MSIVPNSFITESNNSFQLLTELISQRLEIALIPFAAKDEATSSHLSLFTSASITVAPWSLKAVAYSGASNPAPPVTIAILPDESNKALIGDPLRTQPS